MVCVGWREVTLHAQVEVPWMSAKTHLQICVKGEPQETLAPTMGSHTELNPEGMLFVLILKVHY